MKLLEERILKDGHILGDNILKVDSFLTHQVDFSLMREIGKVFAEKFASAGITKVVTIEASGIAPAIFTAEALNVPMIFAKKAKSKNLDGELYTSTVHSYTYGKDFTVTLSKKFLSKEDTVLLIDDFLAVGKAMRGLIDICNQAEAEIAGIGIAIEKGFQSGGKELRETGYDVYSLAIVDEMNDEGMIYFKEQ